jgi:hypothetical protein
MKRGSKVSIALVALALGAGTVALGAPASGARTAPVGYAGPARGVLRQRGIQPDTAHFTSRNWGGYITYPSPVKTDFNVVKASWVQPVVHCQAAQAWTVFWVGIDGWFDGTVEQGGSSAYCPTQNGAPQYSVWWEMYPTNAITTVFSIKAGDTITASVTYSPSTNKFVIVVKDVTTGKSFTRTEACASGVTCNRSSTDVITEDVGHFGSGSYFPLANYGTMGYSAINAKDVAGNSGSITGSHWQNAAVTESSAGITYATVGALSSNGTAFKITWHHT